MIAALAFGASVAALVGLAGLIAYYRRRVVPVVLLAAIAAWICGVWMFVRSVVA